MDSLLSDAIEELLAGISPSRLVREIEAGESAEGLWRDLIESGFADALVPAEQGGAGLSLAEVEVIPFASGRHALPVPLSHTMFVRSYLAKSGVTIPDESITIADVHAAMDTKGGILVQAVPFGFTAGWVVACLPSGHWLLPLAEGNRTRSAIHGSLMADVHWESLPSGAVSLPYDGVLDVEWQCIGAAITAAHLAGAMEKLAEMTIAYANDRTQFGKPIGKLQVIQQQISVLAEQMFSARTAALIGLSGNAIEPMRAAVAKARASEAAIAVAAISHSVHGAIGVTEEYDLQLYIRRLYEWRMQYGSESFWNARIGQAVIDEGAPPLHFIQRRIATVWGSDQAVA